jgi:hypothetical protein
MRFTLALAAGLIGFATTGVLAVPVPQLAGEGAACNSVLSSTDNGVGFGVENAEDNTANTIKSSGGKVRRQLDKIANGAGTVGDAAKVGTVINLIAMKRDSVNSTLISRAANASIQVGNIESSTFKNVRS